MKYIDMHCDSLTKSFDEKLDLSDGELQVNFGKLEKSGCAAQCFAIFTQGQGSASRFFNYAEYFKDFASRRGITVIRNYSDLANCLSGGKTGAVLTVENLGFTENADGIDGLYSLGVRMASLVWNEENALAYPNVVKGNRNMREKRGLKPFGREISERLDGAGIIVDISHLSDGGAEEILRGRKIPAVASHSDCAAVCAAPRNLTDGLIKKIADCGGVAGVNFHKKFLGAGDAFRRVLANVKHLIKVGGEDVIAFGGDFDGIPPCKGLEGCEKTPALLNYLNVRGIPGAALEKLAYKNFARVFKAVCP